MTIEGEWIEWNGGECPVPPNQLVDIRFGGRWADRLRQDPLNWVWEHNAAPLDIIAYRVVSS